MGRLSNRKKTFMNNLRNLRAIPANKPLKLSRKGQSYTHGATMGITLSIVSGKLAKNSKICRKSVKTHDVCRFWAIFGVDISISEK